MDQHPLLADALRSQYHAALAMLRQTFELCPDELWDDAKYTNRFWQLAYHTLYFAHCYMMPHLDDFREWTEHQAGVQYDDAIAGTPDPDSPHPLLPKPYSREQIMRYWRFCDDLVDGAVGAMDLTSESSGFHWYVMSKIEHQLLNLRHIQHGAAQLADRLRSECDLGVRWVGSGAKARELRDE